jgi:hypothetical protein
MNNSFDAISSLAVPASLATPANVLRIQDNEPPMYTISIYGTGNKLLVGIKPDGTVIINEPGADKEAAKVFYESLQYHGQSLVARIAELERELAAYRKSTGNNQRA